MALACCAHGVKRVAFRWIVCGGARSGSAIHTDPVGTAWNALVMGRKRWVVLPPPHVISQLLSTDVLEMLQLDTYNGDHQVGCSAFFKIVPQEI